MTIRTLANRIFGKSLIPDKLAPRYRAPIKRWIPEVTESPIAQARRATSLVLGEALRAGDHDATGYLLEAGKNGGRDPRIERFGSAWQDAEKTWHWTADCMAFVAYVKGFDRYEPETFPLYGGYINTDAMLLDARGWHGKKPQNHVDLRERAPNAWFKLLPQPKEGCIVVYGSRARGTKEGRVGHTGRVRYLDSSIPMTDVAFWETMQADHCSMGNHRNLGHAVATTNGLPWWGRDRHGYPKDTAFLELVDD